MEWIWIGVMVALFLIEAASLNYTAICFFLGSIVGYILMVCEFDYYIQVLTFLLIGILLIVIVRPKLISKIFKVRDKIIKNISEKHPFFIHFIPVDLRIEKEEKAK